MSPMRPSLYSTYLTVIHGILMKFEDQDMQHFRSSSKLRRADRTGR